MSIASASSRRASVIACRVDDPRLAGRRDRRCCRPPARGLVAPNDFRAAAWVMFVVAAPGALAAAIACGPTELVVLERAALAWGSWRAAAWIAERSECRAPFVRPRRPDRRRPCLAGW